MQIKISTTLPALRRPLRTLTMLGLTAYLAACSSNTDLAETNRKLNEANIKIASLEAQLKLLQPTPSAPASERSAAPTAAGEIVSTSGIPRSPVVEDQWSYRSSEEKMSGGTRKIASIESTNTVEFGFPYNGTQHGHLILRSDTQHGKDVMFRLEKGQILCASYDGCAVQIRFDDEKPSKYAASAAADHSSEVVFIDDYSRFLAKMRKAKRVRLAVNIYQQGSPVFEFDVSGFNFTRYQSGG